MDLDAADRSRRGSDLGGERDRGHEVTGMRGPRTGEQIHVRNPHLRASVDAVGSSRPNASPSSDSLAPHSTFGWLVLCRYPRLDGRTAADACHSNTRRGTTHVCHSLSQISGTLPVVRVSADIDRKAATVMRWMERATRAGEPCQLPTTTRSTKSVAQHALFTVATGHRLTSTISSSVRAPRPQRLVPPHRPRRDSVGSVTPSAPR